MVEWVATAVDLVGIDVFNGGLPIGLDMFGSAAYCKGSCISLGKHKLPSIGK